MRAQNVLFWVIRARVLVIADLPGERPHLAGKPIRAVSLVTGFSERVGRVDRLLPGGVPAARVAAAAGLGGQVLVSQASAALVGEVPPPGAELRDRGCTV